MGANAQHFFATEGYSDVQVAASFHLRFQNIHPLIDGNGRIGRRLLAEQILQIRSIPLSVTLSLVVFFEREYRAVFAEVDELAQFARMGTFDAKRAGDLDVTRAPLFSLSPLFQKVAEFSLTQVVLTKT